MQNLRIAGALTLGCLGLALAMPANARMGTGCNGVINPFVWGCAPWDNNNGPKYPYYNAPRIKIPKEKAKIEVHNGAQMVRDLRNNKLMPLVGNDGASMVAAGGGN
ncbi:MAG: hypothetical protein EOP62_05995 [Sphingomonadales bacterium]|nr:MAG: hypothetical protein EOP62_05995 [Sphingomonadales bacterium]